MNNRNEVTESSGRWDASGNIIDAVYEEREKAFKWAKGLNPSEFHWAITVMASDTNAFTLYERKALLEVAALKLDPRKDRLTPSQAAEIDSGGMNHIR